MNPEINCLRTIYLNIRLNTIGSYGATKFDITSLKMLLRDLVGERNTRILICQWNKEIDGIILYHKGCNYIDKKNYKKALKYFNASLSIYYPINSKDSIIWYDKGLVLNRIGRYGEAIESFNKFLRINPRDAVAWYLKGMAHAYLGEFKKAFKSSDMAIKLDQKDSEAWYDRACLYALKGDKKNAFKLLTKATRMDLKWKVWAMRDEDFTKFWNDAEFKQITAR